jgi:hypothetical protein
VPSTQSWSMNAFGKAASLGMGVPVGQAFQPDISQLSSAWKG